MIGFYMFLVLEKFLMLLPKKLRRGFFTALGFIAYKTSKRYNKVVRDNLKLIYGDDVSEEFIEEIAKASFKQLALNLLHTMEIRHYSMQELSKNVSFANDEVVKKAKEQNRPIIFITAHYGSWEFAGAMLGALREPFLTVYTKMKNKHFEEYVLSSRSKSNMEYVERSGATRALVKRLRAGGTIAVLIDTNVNKKEAVTVDFLGKPTGQVKSTAYLARKFDAAIIPTLIHTQDDENFVIKFYDEIIPPKTDDIEHDVKVSTQMQIDWLSKEILKSPKPWFWLHRRFKNDYPEIYQS